MTRFRPTVESLDARTLPSAVFATYDAPTADAVQVADGSSDPAPGDAVTGKVVVQDISFVKRMDKASPML